MKIVVEFELSLEGDITEERAKELFLGEYGLGTMDSMIISQNIPEDSDKDYAVGIDGYNEKAKEGKGK
jgi:hypothetical protein